MCGKVGVGLRVSSEWDAEGELVSELLRVGVRVGFFVGLGEKLRLPVDDSVYRAEGERV